MLMLNLYVGNGVFQACSALSQVILVNGLIGISQEMFLMVDGNSKAVTSSIGSIIIPSSITAIGRNIFILINYLPCCILVCCCF